MAGLSVEVKSNDLMEESKNLQKEKNRKILSNPPVKSGTGYMADELDRLVQNMKDLHESILNLVNASSAMLEKMGIEFEEMDQTSAELYHKIT